MKEELFGPILTVYVYEPEKLEETLEILDTSTDYALTEPFSSDRARIEMLTQRLTHTAGNFYINDKPTGAVVDQQPFGGGRASGTTTKRDRYSTFSDGYHAVHQRAFVPATDYMYPNFWRSKEALSMSSSLADKIIAFNRDLQYPGVLPKGFKVLNPFMENPRRCR